jgi:outer membrane protein assembly factor BamD
MCKPAGKSNEVSADKEFILKAANENFAKKKWKNALALYDRLANLVAGTDDFPNVGFNTLCQLL